MILTSTDISADEFTVATGWEIKPEGACRGDACVPLPEMGRFDLAAVADRLGMALVQDGDVWALGPASLGGRALPTAQAPELVLEDVAGQEFRLSSLRGSKVLRVAWAPY